MAYVFTEYANWADEIAEVSELPEFQTAKIRIVDPNLFTRDYDEDTATWTITGDGVIYDGQARVIPVRWGVHSGGESQANATTLSAIRVQIPRTTATDIRVDKGFKVFVDESPHNLSLGDRMFAVTSDLQGSSSASRTFECMADVDASVNAEVG